MIELLAAASVFTLVLSIALLCIGLLEARPNLSAMFLQATAALPIAARNTTAPRRGRRRRFHAGKLLASLPRVVALLRKLDDFVAQAGLYLRLYHVLLIATALFGAGCAGAILVGGPWPAGWGACAAGMVPVFILIHRHQRLRAFEHQMPVALDMLKSALEAGHSLQRSLRVVADECGDPVGAELRTALEQTQLGLSLPAAIEDTLRRVPIDDLRLLLVALKVQADTGSSLAPIIGHLAQTIRTRQRLRMQMRAITAQSRMGGWILGVMPFAILVIFAIAQPDYARVLTQDPAGIKLLKAAIALDLAALFTIRQLLRQQY